MSRPSLRVFDFDVFRNGAGAAAAARDAGLGCEVLGDGMIARLVRTLLTGLEAMDGSDEPARTIVDLTGDPAVIMSALGRVADLGTIVLAGESLGRRADLDLYRTVHLRGLTLVGIAPPLGAENEREFPGGPPAPDLITECRKALVSAPSGEPATGGAAWYRVSVPAP